MSKPQYVIRPRTPHLLALTVKRACGTLRGFQGEGGGPPPTILVGLLLLALAATAQDSQRNGTGGYWDFEKWDWAPIPPEMGNGLRPLKLKGIDINIDYRGPAYCRWAQDGTGHLVEGKDAFKGKSVRVNNPAYEGNKQHFQIGYHYAFNRILRPGVTYSYEVAVRGEGFFIFQASVQGIEPLTGKTKWLGFPELLKLKLTDQWEVHKGTFTLPDYADPNYRPDELISCAIVVPPGNVVYFDELRIAR